MHTRTQTAATFAALALAACALSAACGSDADPEQPTQDGIEAGQHGAAGSGAPAAPPKHWSGIQVCSGHTADAILKSTSEEVTIGEYIKTATQVRLTGVAVGMAPEYSCEKRDYEAGVRSNSGNTQFGSGSEKQACTSPSGRALVVGDLSGFDSEGLLKFSLNIQEPVEPDAGTSSSTYITCNFDLTLM